MRHVLHNSDREVHPRDQNTFSAGTHDLPPANQFEEISTERSVQRPTFTSNLHREPNYTVNRKRHVPTAKPIGEDDCLNEEKRQAKLAIVEEIHGSKDFRESSEFMLPPSEPHDQYHFHHANERRLS